MATYSLKKFAQPDVLKNIDDDHMLRFLTPYKDYLSGRAFAFEKNGDGRINHAQLSGILLQPTENIPEDMVDALYFIQEVASNASFDELSEIAQEANISVAADLSPEDITVLIWLHDPKLIKQQHADTLILKPKNFISFQSKDGKGRKLDLSPEYITSLARDMDGWFEKNKRGNGCEVIPCDVDAENKVYFLVRHGMPFKREGKIEKGITGSVFYRPEVHDVVVYDKQVNELSIYNFSSSKKERAMYLELFGTHFFDDPEYFLGEDKYTLEPLLADGQTSLACQDIPGMDEVKLTEIQLQFQGPYGDRTIMRSKDMFASWDARKRTFPDYGRLAEAKFQIKFEHSSKPRTIKIKPPNVASFDRKEDAHTIELWLKARGFIKQQQEEAEERPHDHDAQAAVAHA
jgi:hypothetical protein